jgi:hypothetical protein
VSSITSTPRQIRPTGQPTVTNHNKRQAGCPARSGRPWPARQAQVSGRGGDCNGTGTHVKPVRAFQDVRPAAVGSVAVHEPGWCARGRGGGPGRRAAGGVVDQDVQHRAGRSAGAGRRSPWSGCGCPGRCPGPPGRRRWRPGPWLSSEAWRRSRSRRPGGWRCLFAVLIARLTFEGRLGAAELPGGDLPPVAWTVPR